MRAIAALVIVFMFLAVAARAQCVIYACTTTGSWGASFNDVKPLLSIGELKADAYEACKEQGGADCKLLYTSSWSDCNYAVAVLPVGNSFRFGVGISSKGPDDAAYKAKSDIGSNGYVKNYMEAKTTSWYVPMPPPY